MQDELAARRRALTLRLAGRSVKSNCAAAGRFECWFPGWWSRYRQTGAENLHDLTRVILPAQRIPPELERIMPTIRRRPQAHAWPTPRDSPIRPQAVLAERKVLKVHSLPSPSTIERVPGRNGLTRPRVPLLPPLPRQEDPGPHARASDRLQ